MTKAELVSGISEKTGIAAYVVKDVLAAEGELIIEGAESTGSCPVLTLGKVVKISIPAKSGKIKDKVWSTPARDGLKFKPSKLLKEALK